MLATAAAAARSKRPTCARKRLEGVPGASAEPATARGRRSKPSWRPPPSQAPPTAISAGLGPRQSGPPARSCSPRRRVRGPYASPARPPTRQLTPCSTLLCVRYCCRVSRLAEAFAFSPAVNCFDAKSIDAWRPDTSPVTKSHVFGTKPGSTEWLAPARPCSRDAPRPHPAPRRASSARRTPPPRRRCRHREPVWSEPAGRAQRPGVALPPTSGRRGPAGVAAGARHPPPALAAGAALVAGRRVQLCDRQGCGCASGRLSSPQMVAHYVLERAPRVS